MSDSFYDSMTWFPDKTAVVTGAAHGIGRGIAELLADLGARVVAVDIDDAGLHEAFSNTAAIVPWHGDLGAPDTATLADEIVTAHGPVDLLVNNVGIDSPHSFLDLSPRDYDRVFMTNLRGPWFFTKQLVAHLLTARRGGSIVFISSLHDSLIRGLPHYSASKAAVSMLVRELAQALGPAGIRVNSVSPGIVHSTHVTPSPDDDPPRLVPLGRIGEPLDIARITAVLLSDEWAGYVTGANVRVDGGLGVHSFSFDG